MEILLVLLDFLVTISKLTQAIQLLESITDA